MSLKSTSTLLHRSANANIRQQGQPTFMFLFSKNSGTSSCITSTAAVFHTCYRYKLTAIPQNTNVTLPNDITRISNASIGARLFERLVHKHGSSPKFATLKTSSSFRTTSLHNHQTTTTSLYNRKFLMYSTNLKKMYMYCIIIDLPKAFDKLDNTLQQ